MSKSAVRIQNTGEIFTPPKLVDITIDEAFLDAPTLFLDRSKRVLDPCVGDGEFLRGVLRKFKKVRRPTFTKKDWKYAIEYQLFGVDLMWDNVCDTVYYLLRSYDMLQSTKDAAYEIIKQYRGKKTRKEILQLIQQQTNCTEKAAIPLYSISKTTYSDQWIVEHNKKKSIGQNVTTKHKEGHTLTDHSTPEEINQAFESRTYVDDYGTIIIRPQKDSNHYVEYVELKPNEQLNSKLKWIKVENIVRANSLTEWDFERWQPIITFTGEEQKK